MTEETYIEEGGKIKHKCKDCHYLCKECSGFTEYDCISCLPNSGLVLTRLGSCECVESFYFNLINLECEMCDTRCLNCAGPSNKDCLDCKGEFLSVWGENNWCVNDCESLGGYYKDGSYCKCILFVLL